MLGFAIGMIIGAIFRNVITSSVENVLMYLIGFLTGNTDFNYLKIILNGIGAEETDVKYDAFIQDTEKFPDHFHLYIHLIQGHQP